MTVTISGSSGVTYPAGGTANTAGAGVGTTDTQTLTNKTLTNPTITGATFSGTISGGTFSNSSITAANGNTVEATSGPTSTQLAGMRNKIINGAMMIDQRNAGASGTASAYTVDRWQYYGTQASKFTWQQNAGSITPPVGFTNYFGLTSSSSYSITSSDAFIFYQVIEGLNCADLAWGTANAKTVTLSFWVRTSLTGTFGGAIQNSAAALSYNFSYTVSSANTWTYVTVVIPGPTTGTWLTSNAAGVTVIFGLGVGSTYSGASGSWNSGNLVSATGATSVVGTNGATFYITGVQLEKGATATPFENRLLTNELMLCQRYFAKTGAFNSAIPAAGASISTDGILSGTFSAYTSGAGYLPTLYYPVAMRAKPTMTFIPTSLGGTAGQITVYTTGWTASTTLALESQTVNGVGVAIQGSWSAGAGLTYYAWTAAAEL